MTPTVFYVSSYDSDAAVHRRLHGLRDADARVIWAAAQRDADGTHAAARPDIRLGPVRDGNTVQRLTRLPRMVLRLLRHRRMWCQADMICTRNLDVALVTTLACNLVRAPQRRVYEVLDLHPAVLGQGLRARCARWVERRVLARTDMLVVSSDAFVREHFASVQGYTGPVFLMENKLPAAMAPLRRHTAPGEPQLSRDRPLIIGYFGKFRCVHSLELLGALARRFPDRVRLKLAGTATGREARALAELDTLENVSIHGPYVYPGDVPGLYDGVDLAWGLDYAGGRNALHLLPNRLYDACACGVPLLVEPGTETARRAADWGVGIAIARPPLDALVALVETLTPACHARLRAATAALPCAAIYDIGDHARLLRQMLHPRSDIAQ